MNDTLFTLTGIPASEIAARLAEPFDNPAAYKGVPGGADLTDIGTGWMIERATQVFGLRGLGWKLEYSPEHLQFIGLGEGKRVTAHLKYAVFSYALVNAKGETAWYPILTGGASNNDFAYAEEGARTAAIGSALKSLCFQLPVYKGQLDHHNAGKLLGGGNRPGNGNGGKPPGNGNGNGNGHKHAPPGEKASTAQILNELGYGTPDQPGVALDEDPGAYVIQYGKTYTGWPLRQMVEENPKGREAGLTALRWYAHEMKPATESARADQSAARKFLALLEAAPVPA